MTEEKIKQFEEAFSGRIYDPEQHPKLFEYQVKIFKYFDEQSKGRDVIRAEENS